MFHPSWLKHYQFSFFIFSNRRSEPSLVQRSQRAKDKNLTLLLHPLRREIYRLVCETPGTYFFEISNVLNAPHGTVNWHLRKLEKAGLIKSIKFGGKRIFYPSSLRTVEVEKAFAVLKHETAREIFLFIVNNEGAHQSTIAKALNIHHDTVRHHVTRMIEAGLIRSFKVGRKTCYELDELGRKIQEGSAHTITNTYVAILMDILQNNCLHPEIEDVSKDHLTLRIECPGHEDTTFSISLDDWTFSDLDEEIFIKTTKSKEKTEETV